MSSDLNTPLDELTGAQQTMSSWARIIGSYAELPDDYKSSCKSILRDCKPFPYVVFAPVNSDARQRSTEKLIFELNGVFHVWEREGKKIVPVTYPLESINTLEVGSVLLYSWFTINGLTNAGLVSSTMIPFNTVTKRHLLPFINLLRPVPIDVVEAEWRLELARFDYLSSINFKYMNYARESIVRGEKVILSIFQPRIRRRIFKLFGHNFYRTRVYSHLVILTDKEVILLGEDAQSAEVKGKDGKYGGVWQYIPIRNIVAILLTEANDGLITLTIRLKFGDQQLERYFEASNMTTLKDFLREYNQITVR